MEFKKGSILYLIIDSKNPDSANRVISIEEDYSSAFVEYNKNKNNRSIVKIYVSEVEIVDNPI